MIKAAIAAVGAGVAAYGLVAGRSAGKRANQAQGEITAASIRAENLRRQQMRLENFRRQREYIRQSLVARSMAVSNAANQGATFSSGLIGGIAQIQGMMGQSVLAQAQNTQIGEGIFDANIAKMNAELSLRRANTDQSFASGLTSLGTSLMSSASASASNIQSIGSSLFSSSSANAFQAGSKPGPSSLY